MIETFNEWTGWMATSGWVAILFLILVAIIMWQNQYSQKLYRELQIQKDMWADVEAYISLGDLYQEHLSAVQREARKRLAHIDSARDEADIQIP